MRCAARLNQVIGTLVVVSSLAGCATHPDNIDAKYVSTARYADYDCQQIRRELQRVSAEVSEITGEQRDEANKDTAAMAGGLILFWPALFFLIGDDQEEELARLKGQYDAIEKAAIEKKCGVAEELRKAREKRKDKKREGKANDQTCMPGSTIGECD